MMAMQPVESSVYRLKYVQFEQGLEYIRRFTSDEDAMNNLTSIWSATKRVKGYDDAGRLGKEFGIEFLDGWYIEHEHASWYIDRLDERTIGEAIVRRLPWRTLKVLDLGYLDGFETLHLEPLRLNRPVLRGTCELCGKRDGFIDGSTVYKACTGQAFFAMLCSECGAIVMDKVGSAAHMDMSSKKAELASWWLCRLNERYAHH